MILFIWREVLQNYGDGIAFAMAPNREEAMAAILREYEKQWEKGGADGCYSRLKAQLENGIVETHTAPFGGWLEGTD